MRALIFSTDIPPLPGVPTSGTALRTFGLAEGLRSFGWEVVYSPPRAALLGAEGVGTDKALVSELRRFAFDGTNQREIIERVQPDVVVFGHWPASIMPGRPRAVTVQDLPGPYLLERHFQGMKDERAAIFGKLAALQRADLFIVSGPAQQSYFRSFADRASIPDFDARCITIPMPLSPIPPLPSDHKLKGEYPRLMFAGLFLPWQDPSWAIQETVAHLDRRGVGSLTLIGGEHPHYPVKSALYERLFKELSTHPRVTQLPLMPFDKLTALLGSADVALDLMAWNVERELAVTIRSTGYLWAGLPVIYNDFSDLSQLIKEWGAGWTVAEGDLSSLHTVLDGIIDDPEQVKRAAAQAGKLSQEVFSWDRALNPLVERVIALSPRRGEGGGAGLDVAQAPLVHVDHPLGRVTGSLALTQGNAIDGLRGGLTELSSGVVQYFRVRRPGLSEITLTWESGVADTREAVEATLYRVMTPQSPDGAVSFSLSTASPSMALEPVPCNVVRSLTGMTLSLLSPDQASAGGLFALAVRGVQVAAQAKGISTEPVHPVSIHTSANRFPALKLFYDGIEQVGRALRFSVHCLNKDTTSGTESSTDDLVAQSRLIDQPPPSLPPQAV